MHSLILAWASYILAMLLPAQSTEVEFYGEHFVVEYQPRVFANGALELSESGISYHYAAVTEKDWLPLHTQLQRQRRKLELNDWLYVKLVRETVDAIADFTKDSERRVLEMHLLTLAGYDAILCYSDFELYVYAHTEAALFEVPMISNDERRYVNLSAALTPRKSTSRSLNLHPLRPLPNGKPVGFSLATLPQLTPNVQTRTFRFYYKDKLQTIHGLSDRTIAAYMNDYPFFDEGLYVQAPMSATTSDRLLSELRPMLDGKSQVEQLQFLAAFTRGAFEYKEDKVSFGYSKPMIPDEVLYYPVSDCEDRSALYYLLVRELLDLPVLAIAYKDHLSIAVASLEFTGEGFMHEGTLFHICDPTGPKDSDLIGEPPFGYADQSFKIVAEHKPSSEIRLVSQG